LKKVTRAPAGKVRSISRPPGTVDEYLASVSPDKRIALSKLRAAIRATAPRAEECISYGVPSFRLDGKFLFSFGAGARHCAFYPGSAPIAAHRKELASYELSKGTIRFPADRPLPASLVRKLVKTRVAERSPRPRAKGRSRVR
jgi:uncharacterized protein YdhG (YjbR/CyaY superfamily)